MHNHSVRAVATPPCTGGKACELLGGAEEVESIDFSAFTAGTGNAGTTILSATVSHLEKLLMLLL